ncbi:MAG: PL29 family lyase N-terminal domain-containing protein [Candidatus Cryptobacteroides sp.]|nr:PL29 family lyase N-terminal domain-containing protein [Bacteroidales bacterium]MDY3963971.1 PL29 family lyase N-terminal domain-containing protein [Candidatus Cryptobacteroides sp.]
MKTRTCLYFVMAALTAITLAGCSKYDDTALKNDIESLESRIQALEKRCDEMNSNIASLKAILDAVQAQKKITDVSSTSTGYVITFSDNSSITLNHGKDGSTPAISVRQDTDGQWYWMLNGDWLLDSNGKKVRATAIDGNDGVTPLLKIENEYWYLSSDNGKTWVRLAKATGEDGDSFFKSVSQDDGYVYIVLADGTSINIPKESRFALSFDNTAFHPASETMTIPFNVIAAGDDLNVVTFSDSNIATKVYLKGTTSGTIEVTFIGANHNGNVLVVAKSNGKTIMEILAFEEGILSTSSTTEYWIGSDGQEINVSISRNMDISIVSSVSWITVTSETKSLVKDNLCITVAPNDTYQNREGMVTINGEEGGTLVFTIHQEPKYYIVLDKTSVTIMDDETVKIGYATNVSGELKWSSSNPGVATVNFYGLVSAVSKGETIITVSSEDGKYSANCKVTVKTFMDGIRVYCSGGSFMMVDNLIRYGSKINWTVMNNTGQTVTVDSIYLVDGENGNKTNIISLNTDLETGKSAGWTITIPLAGIHAPVTAVFSISCNGKTYTASAEYNP